MSIRQEYGYDYYNQAVTYLLKNRLGNTVIERLEQIRNKNELGSVEEVVHKLISIVAEQQKQEEVVQ